MTTILTILGVIIVIWVIYLIFYSSGMKYLQKGLIERLYTASKIVVNGGDLAKNLESANINYDIEEGNITWGYQSFPNWFFIYHPDLKMITVNCTIANKKFNMITLWSNFDDGRIDLTWSINRHNFAGQLNQDAVIFLKNLSKYGVRENKDMNY